MARTGSEIRAAVELCMRKNGWVTSDLVYEMLDLIDPISEVVEESTEPPLKSQYDVATAAQNKLLDGLEKSAVKRRAKAK